MTKRIIAVALLGLFLLGAAGCNITPEETPTPAPTEVARDPIHVDSPLVGQWTPTGSMGQGYFQFTEDGQWIMMVEDSTTGELHFTENYYELESEDVVRLIPKNGLEHKLYSFELHDDNNTLEMIEVGATHGLTSTFARIK